MYIENQLEHLGKNSVGSTVAWANFAVETCIELPCTGLSPQELFCVYL